MRFPCIMKIPRDNLDKRFGADKPEKKLGTVRAGFDRGVGGMGWRGGLEVYRGVMEGWVE